MQMNIINKVSRGETICPAIGSLTRTYRTAIYRMRLKRQRGHTATSREWDREVDGRIEYTQSTRQGIINFLQDLQ